MSTERYILRVVTKTESRDVALPAEGQVVVGRSRSCDVHVQDASVSSRHLRIHVASGRLSVEDLGSGNGTIVSLPAVAPSGGDTQGTEPLHSQRLEPNKPMPWPQGALLRAGRTVLVYDRVQQTKSAGAPLILDPAMVELYDLVDKVADAPISVLLLGETGVGKEVVATSIVTRSGRAEQPFLRVNCGAFSETLLEAELFGNEKGAFTGADRAKPGLFEAAHTGTLFLDEVGELSPATQVKLLRVLDSHEVTRLGATTPRKIDVRIIAATNRDVPAMVAAGEFRDDLYFRLNGFTLVIPPLRERRTEIRPLVERFARSAARGRPVEFSEAALALLESHSYPGNIRELRNIVDRAVLLGGPGPLGPELLPFKPAQAQTTAKGGLKAVVDQAERERILTVLQECGGNQTRAAKQLGISRTTLVARLEKYGVARPRKR